MEIQVDLLLRNQPLRIFRVFYQNALPKGLEPYFAFNSVFFLDYANQFKIRLVF